jgi:uncharacterized protein YacL (UPF0231 family)
MVKYILKGVRMMEYLYNNFGMEIYKKGEEYYLRYDAGELVVQMNEIEITKEEVMQIQSQKSSEELYQYLIKNLNKRMSI